MSEDDDDGDDGDHDDHDDDDNDDDLRLVQAGLLVRAKERWSGAVDRSRTIPLVPRLGLSCHLW